VDGVALFVAGGGSGCYLSRLQPSGRERQCFGSMERKRQPREDAKVGMQLNARVSTHAERRESVLVFQPSEFALHRSTSPVQVAEALRVTRDAREHPTANRDGQDWLLALDATERDDGFAAALFALGVDAVVVVALVHRARLGVEAASVERVEHRRDEQRLVVARGARLPHKRQARRGANGHVDLVAIEAAALAGADRERCPHEASGSENRSRSLPPLLT
jgi:hypothetical protein